MGYGDPGRQHQAGVIRQAQVSFHNVPFRECVPMTAVGRVSRGIAGPNGGAQLYER